MLKVSGAGAAFGVDAASFGMAADLLATIRFNEQAVTSATRSALWQEGRTESTRLLRAMWEGLQFVGRDRVPRSLVAIVALVNLMVAGPLAVGLPTLAWTRFAAGPLAFALLLSAFGGRALIGATLAGLPSRSRRWRQWIPGAVGMFALCFLLISGTANAQVAALAVGLAGAGAGFVLVMIFTSFQQRGQPELRAG